MDDDRVLEKIRRIQGLFEVGIKGAVRMIVIIGIKRVKQGIPGTFIIDGPEFMDFAGGFDQGFVLGG